MPPHVKEGKKEGKRKKKKSKVVVYHNISFVMSGGTRLEASEKLTIPPFSFCFCFNAVSCGYFLSLQVQLISLLSASVYSCLPNFVLLLCDCSIAHSHPPQPPSPLKKERAAFDPTIDKLGWRKLVVSDICLTWQIRISHQSVRPA